jgi:ribonucleoside-diphosphate reductase alpha chain
VRKSIPPGVQYLKEEARRAGTGRCKGAGARLPQRPGDRAGPTGTIAFLMDCDTTGVEPDIALVKYKLLAGAAC